MQQTNKLPGYIGLVAVMILLASLTRLIPHPPNFAPITGMALFGAAVFSRKWLAILIPFAALWFSDLLLNNVLLSQYYDSFQWMGYSWTYLAFALILVLGFVFLQKVSLTRLFGTTVLSSVLFFIVTNFGVWMGSGMYEKSMTGLMAAFAAGIPFFPNTLVGDLFYVSVLFGSYYWIRQRMTQPAQTV